MIEGVTIGAAMFASLVWIQLIRESLQTTRLENGVTGTCAYFHRFISLPTVTYDIELSSLKIWPLLGKR
jgi:hypothetical protein